MNSSVYTVLRGVTCLNLQSNQEKMTCVSCSKRKKQNLMNLAWATKCANRSINNDSENQDPRKKDFSRVNFLGVVV